MFAKVLMIIVFVGVCAPGQAAESAAVFTTAQAEAGRAAFDSSCAKCHTEKLTGHDGTGEIPEIVRPYKGKIPPLAGTNAAFEPFLAKWGEQTTRDLYLRIKSATGAFPPPGRRVDDELYLDLAAYILQVNGAKAGPRELKTGTAVEIRAAVAARQ